MKLAFLAPIVPLNEVHINRPYFELPKAMSLVESEGFLLAGKISIPCDMGIKIYETGIESNKQRDIFRAFHITSRVLWEEHPDLVVFFHMNVLLSVFILLHKFRTFFSKRRFQSQTIWVLKLDWDGSNFEDLGKTGMKIRNLFLSFNSLFLDFLVAENSCSYKATVKMPFIHKERVKLIPNACSTDFPKIKYDLKEREKMILSVSRMVPEKGIDILIKSYIRISKRFPEWCLTIVGPIENREYYDLLKNMINEHSISSQVKIVGPIYGDELRNLYRKASIFCLASYSESFGMVRIEAIESGIPLITTTAGCGNDFKKFGSLIVPPSDIEALSNALTTLMKSEKLRLEISEAQQNSFPDYAVVAKLYKELATNALAP